MRVSWTSYALLEIGCLYVRQNLSHTPAHAYLLAGWFNFRFTTVKMRLASLSTTFSNNVLDETKAFSLTVTDPAQLEGVPDSAKAMWANAHVQEVNKNNEDGGDPITMDPNAGPWRITLDMPSYIAVLSHVPDRALRQQVALYIALVLLVALAALWTPGTALAQAAGVPDDLPVIRRPGINIIDRCQFIGG